MKVQDLQNTLKKNGFEEEILDSGCNYRKSCGHIVFICYFEPDIEVQFIIIYRWNNNDVKGTHNISVKEFSRTSQPVKTFFNIAKENIPRYIGEFTDTHEQIDQAMQELEL